ncbi:MAG: HAD family hydrolase, partial [Anaerolineae bacterium]|nr:HAD family hydrolase [Anaerolineae bacterium]
AWTVWERTWIEEHRSLPISCWLDELLGALDAKLPSDTRRSLCRTLQEIYLSEDCAPQPIAGVLDIVPRLAQRYRLGLISDTGLTPGRVLREVMNRDGLLRYFSVETFSDEIGVTKPEPQAFIHTLEALGVPAGAAAHIGDLPETDIVGARGVGMRAILFLGKSHREDGRPLADAVFEDYAELENLLMDLP